MKNFRRNCGRSMISFSAEARGAVQTPYSAMRKNPPAGIKSGSSALWIRRTFRHFTVRHIFTSVPLSSRASGFPFPKRWRAAPWRRVRTIPPSARSPEMPRNSFPRNPFLKSPGQWRKRSAIRSAAGHCANAASNRSVTFPGNTTRRFLPPPERKSMRPGILCSA